jgi:ankyrin repeat protein
MIKTLLILSVLSGLLLTAVPVFGQAVDTAWVRRYNGPGNSGDTASALAVDGSGNVYVTGYSVGSGTNYDYATIKYLPTGDTAWVRRYNGPGNDLDEVHALAVDASGNVYVTGRSYGSGTALDYATIKYLPNGDTAWVRRYDGPANWFDGAYALTVDGSGNVYVTGGSEGSGTSDDYATIKYLSNGDTAWVRRYNGPGNSGDCASALAVDSSGNVYVTGRSMYSGDYDYATIKYNSNGDTAWVRRYNGPGNSADQAYALAVDGSGNVYVTGRSIGSGTDYDYATIKYNSNGDTAWVRRYNGSGNSGDYVHALAVDGSGNVYVTGMSPGSVTSDDYATIKYLSNGDTAWVRRYDESESSGDYAYALAVDGSGNVYVIGGSWGSGTSYDYATIKYLPTGNTAWVRKYNGPGNMDDFAYAITVDGPGNVYVTGGSNGSGTALDYTTIKYRQSDFATAVNYGAGDMPVLVFCADLDGDRDLDLAVTNYYSGNVSILKNNGDGTFQTKVDYGVGSSPLSVFCADLDGDTDLDLAVANITSNNVSILKNNGDGTFQPKVDYDVGGGPWSVFCADLDGDTDLDLAVVNSANGNVSILKNNGDGSFQMAINYWTGDNPHSVFCADLDGDRDLDLAVAKRGEGNVSILKNNGDGTFQAKLDYGVGDQPYSVFCADLDGDTDLDLAVANSYSDNVSILKNNGDGTFQPKVDYAAGAFPRSVFCADLDGDTDLDLAVANDGSDNVSILKNNGDGTFKAKVNYGAGYSPASVFCSDLDGDDDLDLAVANKDNVSILKNLTQVPANQPPWAFSLISPTDQDTIFSTVTFRWQTPYDPNFGDQIRYDLHLSTVPGFDPDSTIVYDSLPLAKFTNTLSGDIYYWKLKAYDNWGAETWSTQSWSFTIRKQLPDTLQFCAYSPVDLIVSDPVGRWISVDSNFIPDATYDTTTDKNNDGDKDDIVTIPNPVVGNYTVQVKAEPDVDTGHYSITVKLNGNEDKPLALNLPIPPPGEVDTFSYPVIEHLRGDANMDGKKTVSDVVFLINYLFKGGPAPNPVYLGDVNCDGKTTVSDVVYLINYLFKGGSAPCS